MECNAALALCSASISRPLTLPHVSVQPQESWSQLPAVLQWFGSSVVIEEPTAKLAFTSCLPKELRADVHTCVPWVCGVWRRRGEAGCGVRRMTEQLVEDWGAHTWGV